MRVNAEPQHRAEILRSADIFRAKVVDVTPTTFTLEATGEESKLEAHHRAPAAHRHPGAGAHREGRHRARARRRARAGWRSRSASRRRQRAAAAETTTRRWSGSPTRRTRTTEGEHTSMPAKIYYDQDADLGAPPRQEDRDHRLRQPGARPRAEPQGLGPGRRRRPLQGLEELGRRPRRTGSRSPTVARGRPDGRHRHDPAARPDPAADVRGVDQGRARQGQDADVRPRLHHPLQPGGAARRRGRLHDRAQGARAHHARPLHAGPGRARPARRPAGRVGQGPRHGARLRQGRGLHARRRHRDDLQGRDGDRPLRRADRRSAAASRT